MKVRNWSVPWSLRWKGTKPGTSALTTRAPRCRSTGCEQPSAAPGEEEPARGSLRWSKAVDLVIAAGLLDGLVSAAQHPGIVVQAAVLLGPSLLGIGWVIWDQDVAPRRRIRDGDRGIHPRDGQ